MNTITNLNTFPIGNSLDGINIISDEINTLSLLVDGTNSMLADLNMNNHIIKNMEAGVDSLDAVNKSQLDLKADTSYVNTQLALKVNKAGDTMTGALNMNTTNKIVSLANGTNPTDAVNKSQLDTKADTTYVNAQLGLKLNKAGDTMTGALNMNSTNKIINLANGTSIGDAINLGQLTAINNSLTADINDLENYVDIQDTALRTYVDAQDNLKVNKAGDTMTGNLLMSGGNNVRFNNDPANSDGASLTYATNFNELLLLVNSGATNRGFDLRVSTGNPGSGSTRIWAQADGKVGINTRTPSEILDVNGNSKIRGYLDMSSNKISNLFDPSLAQDATTKNYVDTSLNLLRTYVDTQDSNDRTYVDSSLNMLRAYVDTQDTSTRTYTDSSLNLKVNKSGDTMTNVLSISKNASTAITFTSSTQYTTATTYDNYILTSSATPLVLYLPILSGNSMINKTIFASFPNNTLLQIQPATTGTIVINGTSYTSSFPSFGNTFKRVVITGLATAGQYIVEIVSNYSNYDGLDQLVLKTNLADTLNTEFTGIKFSNTNIDSGIIRVETDRDHNNSVMRLYTRSANNIILPLELGNIITAFKPVVFSDNITANGNITANSPIIRNAWTSGELIQTKIYNQTTNNSGVQQINANSNGTSAYVDWKTISFTTLNTPTDSILVIEVFAPYLYNGTLGDRLTSKIVDTTSSQTVVESGAAYINGGGGGARGLPFLPVMGSYTPTGTTKTRSIKISFDNDGDDILYICRILPRGSVITDKDNYTIKVSEYKK